MSLHCIRLVALRESRICTLLILADYRDSLMSADFVYLFENPTEIEQDDPIPSLRPGPE